MCPVSYQASYEAISYLEQLARILRSLHATAIANHGVGRAPPRKLPTHVTVNFYVDKAGFLYFVGVAWEGDFGLFSYRSPLTNEVQREGASALGVLLRLRQGRTAGQERSSEGTG